MPTASIKLSTTLSTMVVVLGHRVNLNGDALFIAFPLQFVALLSAKIGLLLFVRCGSSQKVPQKVLLRKCEFLAIRSASGEATSLSRILFSRDP